MKTFTSWYNYYQTEEKPISVGCNENLIFNEENNTFSILSGDAYIYNCFFESMNPTSGIGALYYEVANGNLLVEKSSFFDCKSLEYTSAIRVVAGNCVIAFTCGYHCCSGINDGFCSIHYDSNRNIASIIESTVSHCKSEGEHMIILYYGFVSLNSVNISDNEAKLYSALTSYPNKLGKNENIGTVIHFCSFANNTATKDYCLYFSDEHNTENIDIKYIMRNSNVLNNKGTNGLFCRCELTIEHSSIIRNDDPLLKMHDANSKLTLQSCYSDSIIKSNVGTVIQNNKSDVFVLALPFFELGKCVNIIQYDNHLLRQTQCRCNKLLLYKFGVLSPLIFILSSKN